LREALELDPEHQKVEEELVSLLQSQERYQDVASYLEAAAERSRSQARRAQRLRKAADLYHHRLGRPDAAAIALLALPSFEAQELVLMAEAAEQLQQSGKSSEVAQLDSVLLATDPLRSPNFERHLAFLKDCADHRALAALQLRRARALTGWKAARSYLEAALSYRSLNQEEQARECERQAFAQGPEDDQAFAAARSQAESDPRQLAEVLFHRARSKPEEATSLLRQRAHLLAREESLLAAQALDDLLQVAPDDAEALRERGDLAARASGPSAAQPFDRRLLAVAGDELSPELLSKLYLRLGSASFGSGAFRDAADSLEEVVRLNVNGDQSREALSLLSESYSQLADMPGLFRVTLQLAGRSSGEEADALYRRAADVGGEPAQALDALLPLARLRPSDSGLVARAARGLRDLERFGELAEL